MIPGQNLLNMALTLIARQSVQYYQFNGRYLNAIGQDVSTYLNPKIVTGSFQPIEKRLYEQYGLDLQKSYFNFYVPRDVIDIRRDVSSDQLVFNNDLYQCLSCTEWIALDGWVAVLCVYVGANVPNNKPIFGFDITPAVSQYVNYYYSNYSLGADD